MSLTPPSSPSIRARRSNLWLSLVLTAVLLLGFIPGFPASALQPLRIANVSAQEAPCVDYDAGAFVSRICFISPAGHTSVSGTITASVEVTALSGTMPHVAEVRFFLEPVTWATSQPTAVDVTEPYALSFSTDRWVDGEYRLEAEVVFIGEIVATARPVLFLSLANGVTIAPHSGGTWVPATSDASPLHIVAVGDGAGGNPHSAEVGDLATSLDPDLFFYLGDVYEYGTYTEFMNYYETTLGTLKSRTNPIPGNHEARDGFVGYMDYWDTGAHYYSFDSGGWHFIALNNTREFDQTSADSAQYAWLAQDLMNNPAACTMVLMHYPRFNSAKGYPHLDDMWSLLDAYGVDVVLAGHEHNYQRWHPMDVDEQIATSGMRQYIVGTGGVTPIGFYWEQSGVAHKLQADGVLSMSLHPTGGTTRFITTSGETLDETSFNCDNYPGHGMSALGTVTDNGSYTFLPVADARVQASNPLDNFGDETVLGVEDGDNDTVESYIRFNVTGVPENATNASLQVYIHDTPTAGSHNGPELYLAEPSGWTEDGITWATRPPRTPAPVAHVNEVHPGTWVTYDVSSVVNGNGDYTFVLATGVADNTEIASRETATAPHLVFRTVEAPPTEAPGEELSPTADAVPAEETGATSESITLAPVADTYVSADDITSNFGTSSTLAADTNPEQTTYLRFDVQGLSGPPAAATLRLHVTNGTDEGPTLYRVDDTSWSETGMTWSDRPESGALLGEIPGSVRLGTWVEFDVTSEITGNGLVSFAVEASSSDGITFMSRRGGTTLAPQLVIHTTESAATWPDRDAVVQGSWSMTGVNASAVRRMGRRPSPPSHSPRARRPVRYQTRVKRYLSRIWSTKYRPFESESSSSSTTSGATS